MIVALLASCLAAAAPAEAEVDVLARLLAGMPIPESSAFAAVAADPEYKAYAGRIETAWGQYEAQDRHHLLPWVEQELKDVPAGPVFYPFSGPDLLNVVTLFPRGTTYTLLGLEPTGGLPAAKDAPQKTVAELKKLERALHHIFGRNYFVTDAMAMQLDEDLGVSALMLFFAARAGYEVRSLEAIELAPDGTVHAVTDAKEAVRGIELRFRKRGTTAEQVARYFPGDASDARFNRAVGLRQHIEAQGGLVTLLKAASYLLFYPEFDDVRALVLARSQVVLTEASGMPFHYLNNPGWRLSLYGSYDRPIKSYADRCQPDLKAALEKDGRGELPFRFSYEFKRKTHLVLARRAAENALGQPAYDGSTRTGENTVCRDNKLRVSSVNLK